jgi:hypothetical protein
MMRQKLILSQRAIRQESPRISAGNRRRRGNGRRWDACARPLYVRGQVLPWLGVGVAYLGLSAQSTDNRPTLREQAIEVDASWHPLVECQFDPYVQLGGLKLVEVSGDDFEPNPHSRWGAEGQVGMNFVFPHLAIGVQLRHATAGHQWTLLGLQLEGRI